MRNICARFSHNAQYMRNICARLYFFPNAQHCTYFSNAQHCTYFSNAQHCTYFSNAQYMHKIVFISPMRARFDTRLYLFPECAICAQDCTYFPNAQYMRKICARLYLFPQCTIYAQDYRHYWKKHVTYHISALNLEWYSLRGYFWIATSVDFFLNKHL